MVYDNLDFLRGVEVFLNFIPATSIEAIRRGMRRASARRVQPGRHLRSVDGFQSALPHGQHRHGLLLRVPRPGNGRADGRRDPARLRAGHGERRILPLRRWTWASPARTQGKGGKYLIVPASYKGDVPKDKKDGGEYFVARSPSYVNWLILRGFLVDGKPDAATKMFREGLKIYPLAKAGNPPQDGVRQRLEEVVQHHPRQHLRVLSGARPRHPEGTDRLSSIRNCAAWRRASASQGQAVRARTSG